MAAEKSKAEFLLDCFARQELFRWIGVPDSTLEPLIQVLDADSRFGNLISTNECEAMSIAMGRYLGSGEPCVVYLQNSGFGKTIHPLTSLLAPEICRIPALLVIGWRGAPDGAPDEPQHQKMGRVMPQILSAIEVPYEVLTADPEQIARAIANAKSHLKENRSPYALIVRPGLLNPVPAMVKSAKTRLELTRKRVLELAIGHLSRDTLFVSTTGKTSRELYFIREDRKAAHASDFYTVGGMGCASSIAFGVALELARSDSHKQVCIFDGDGAALMQLGSMAMMGHHQPGHLLHILIDNECYESTGAQPTLSPSVDFIKVAQACGYPWARLARTEREFKEALIEAVEIKSLRLIVVKTAPGSDPKLGRPTETARENARNFLKSALCKK